MKHFIILISLIITVTAKAQEAFTGFFYCEELKATMQLDITKGGINLPDLDFENAYGVLKGNINGTWVALKVKKADNKTAVVRMINDIGVDAQDVELKLTDDGNIELRLVKEQNIKTIEGKKYVKLPKVCLFKKPFPGPPQ